LVWRSGIPPTASPRGEEEPGPEGAERGGYLPIPRRDARAGEWETWRRISGSRTWPQWPERPGGSESPSVYNKVNSDEQSVKQSVRSGRVQPAARRNDEAGGVRDPG